MLRGIVLICSGKEALLQPASSRRKSKPLRNALKKIEHALQGKPGIKEVRIDPVTGIVSVTFDTRQTNLPEIHDLLLSSGYRPTRSVPE